VSLLTSLSDTGALANDRSNAGAMHGPISLLSLLDFFLPLLRSLVSLAGCLLVLRALIETRRIRPIEGGVPMKNRYYSFSMR
jgi:hypothetical protein